MQKRRKMRAAALLILTILGASLISGCGKKEQTAPMNDYEKGTVEKTVGGVTFSVPSRWSVSEESGDRLVAVASDDAGTEAVFTFEYLRAEKSGVNAIIVDEVLSSASERYGFSTGVYLPTVVGEITSAKTGVYTRRAYEGETVGAFAGNGKTEAAGSGGDAAEAEVSEHGLIVPIAGEGCFFLRKTIASGVYDAFEADYSAIESSIVLPENASDDGSVSVEGTTLAESVTELSDSVTLRLAVIEYEGGRLSFLQDFSFLDMAGMSALYGEAYENARTVSSDVLASSTLTIHFISRLCTTVYDLEKRSEVVYATDEDGNVFFTAPAWLTEEAPLDPADPADALAKYRSAWEDFLSENGEYFR